MARNKNRELAYFRLEGVGVVGRGYVIRWLNQNPITICNEKQRRFGYGLKLHVESTDGWLHDANEWGYSTQLEALTQLMTYMLKLGKTYKADFLDAETMYIDDLTDIEKYLTQEAEEAADGSGDNEERAGEDGISVYDDSGRVELTAQAT